MNRFELHSFFKTSSTVILPVIHVLDNEQVTRNIHIAQNNKVSGVFLINHDLSINFFLPIIRHVLITLETSGLKWFLHWNSTFL